MGTVIAIVGVGAALNVALWGALYHQLRTLPQSAWRLSRRDRAADEGRALDVLQAAAASRIGGLILGIRSYHEQLAGLMLAQLAEAEVRARLSERRSSEAGVALDAASTLVRDLRTLAEDLPSLFDRRALNTGIAIGEAAARRSDREPSHAPEPEARATVELPRGASAPETVRKPDCPAPASRERPLTELAAEERESGDEELTVIQDHALSGTRTLLSAGKQDGAS